MPSHRHVVLVCGGRDYSDRRAVYTCLGRCSRTRQKAKGLLNWARQAGVLVLTGLAVLAPVRGIAAALFVERESVFQIGSRSVHEDRHSANIGAIEQHNKANRSASSAVNVIVDDPDCDHRILERYFGTRRDANVSHDLRPHLRMDHLVGDEWLPIARRSTEHARRAEVPFDSFDQRRTGTGIAHFDKKYVVAPLFMPPAASPDNGAHSLGGFLLLTQHVPGRSPQESGVGEQTKREHREGPRTNGDERRVIVLDLAADPSDEASAETFSKGAWAIGIVAVGFVMSGLIGFWASRSK